MKTTKFTLLTAILIAAAGCRPAQKDPSLEVNLTRKDSLVDEARLSDAMKNLGVPQLWKKTTGKLENGNRVLIAVVGTGIDYRNPDLRDALHINLGEAGDKEIDNGMDDDKNGLPDDVIGFDFFSGDGTPFDWHGHDTYTASLIAATGLSNPNVLGVAPNASLMINRYIGPDGRGAGMDAATALSYSIFMGCDIIYFNWPQGGFDSAETPLVIAEFEAARKENILIVMPAGNSGNDKVPALVELAKNLPNVIIVAGTDLRGELTPTTVSGRNRVEVAAPQMGSRGYFPGSVESTDLQTTSVAAAYVTGAAALLSTLPGMGDVTKIREALLKASRPSRDGKVLDILAQQPLYLGNL